MSAANMQRRTIAVELAYYCDTKKCACSPSIEMIFIYILLPYIYKILPLY